MSMENKQQEEDEEWEDMMLWWWHMQQCRRRRRRRRALAMLFMWYYNKVNKYYNNAHKYKIGERFPEYYGLQEVFGKDHATGVRTTNIEEAYEQEVQRSKAAATDATTDGTTMGSSFGMTNDIGDGNEATASDVVMKGKKKLKDSEMMPEFITSMKATANGEREDDAKFFEMMGKRKRVILPGECAKVEEEMYRLGVPEDAVVDAIFNLTERPQFIDTFWEIRESKRAQFAMKLARM